MKRHEEKLREQIRFLRKSCGEYDRGDEAEFVRIAASVCIIVDNAGRNSVSLLSRLGQADMQMLSTSVNPLNRSKDSPFGNLTNLKLISMVGGKFSPIGDGKMRNLIDIDDWWTVENVFVRNAVKISRRDVVRWARDKDGGAHVDASLPQAYKDILEEGAGWSMTINPTGGESRTVVFTGAPQSAVRQIGYEVLRSLQVEDSAP